MSHLQISQDRMPRSSLTRPASASTQSTLALMLALMATEKHDPRATR